MFLDSLIFPYSALLTRTVFAAAVEFARYGRKTGKFFMNFFGSHFEIPDSHSEIFDSHFENPEFLKILENLRNFPGISVLSLRNTVRFS